jgi:hypothetical protein
MRPQPRSRMSPTTARESRYGPTRLAVTDEVNRSGGAFSNSSPGSGHPGQRTALFTRTSTGPSRQQTAVAPSPSARATVSSAASRLPW